MIKQAAIALCVSIAFLAAPGSAIADEGVPLAFSFTPGEVMQYDITLSGAGGLRAPDGELAPVGLQGNLRLVCTVVSVLQDGSGQVQLLTPEASLRATVGPQEASFSYQGGSIRWSADGKQQAPPDADVSRIPLLGTPVTVTLAPNGRVTDVVVPGMENLPELQQVAPELQRPQFEGLGEALFPDAPVQVGESWRRATQVTPFGSSMPITLTTRRTLDDFTDEGGISLARISGHSEARLRAGPVAIAPGEQELTVSVPEFRQTLTSTEFLNTAEGKLVRADYSFALTSRFGIGVAGQQQEGGIEARFQATVQAR